MPHIRMAHPTHIPGLMQRGRASTRPYIAHCKSRIYNGIASRSCRGDWEVTRRMFMARHVIHAQFIPARGM